MTTTYFFGDVLAEDDTYSEAKKLDFVDTFLHGAFEANASEDDRHSNGQCSTPQQKG